MLCLLRTVLDPRHGHAHTPRPFEQQGRVFLAVAADYAERDGWRSHEVFKTGLSFDTFYGAISADYAEGDRVANS